MTSVLKAGAFPIWGAGTRTERKINYKINTFQQFSLPSDDALFFFFILTGSKICSDALTELIVQLRVQDGNVLSVWAQIPQRVLGDPAWDPLLDGGGAPSAQIKTVAGDDGTGSFPYDNCTVVPNVSELQISG